MLECQFHSALTVTNVDIHRFVQCFTSNALRTRNELKIPRLHIPPFFPTLHVVWRKWKQKSIKCTHIAYLYLYFICLLPHFFPHQATNHFPQPFQFRMVLIFFLPCIFLNSSAGIEPATKMYLIACIIAIKRINRKSIS